MSVERSTGSVESSIDAYSELQKYIQERRTDPFTLLAFTDHINLKQAQAQFRELVQQRKKSSGVQAAQNVVMGIEGDMKQKSHFSDPYKQASGEIEILIDALTTELNAEGDPNSALTIFNNCVPIYQEITNPLTQPTL